MRQYHESGLGSNTLQTPTVEAAPVSVGFAVGKAALDGLATKTLASRDFLGGHLLALSIEQLLTLESLDCSTA